MGERVGFVTMGEAVAVEGEVPTLGVGMLGYAFMGKAHTNAYKTLDYIYAPPPARPRLVAIAGRTPDRVAAAAQRYGYEKAVTDWWDLVTDPEIQVLDNCTPNNLHAEPCIAAAQAGKHIICEKPLGRTADEARRMWEAASGDCYLFHQPAARPRQLRDRPGLVLRHPCLPCRNPNTGAKNHSSSIWLPWQT